MAHMCDVAVACATTDPVSLVTSHSAESIHPYQEAFWQQYPSWVLPFDDLPPPPSASNNYYRYAMDSPAVIIGSKSKFSNARPPSTHKAPRGGKAGGALGEQGRGGKAPVRRNKQRPTEKKVAVYIKQELIAYVPLRLLVRFSTTAQEAFPKPNPSSQAIQADANTEIRDSTSPPSAATQQTASRQTHPEGKLQKQRVLQLEFEDLWFQPPADAFKFAFDWMYAAERSSTRSCPSNELPAYGVPEPEQVPFEMLINLYAASLSLGLRPKPNKLRQDLFDRLTESPPGLEQLVTVHERLPVYDGVMTRLLTSFVRNRGQKKGWYTKAQRDQIEEYVHVLGDDDALRDRYAEIEENSRLPWQGKGQGKHAERLQRLAEGQST